MAQSLSYSLEHIYIAWILKLAKISGIHRISLFDLLYVCLVLTLTSVLSHHPVIASLVSMLVLVDHILSLMCYSYEAPFLANVQKSSNSTRFGGLWRRSPDKDSTLPKLAQSHGVQNSIAACAVGSDLHMIGTLTCFLPSTRDTDCFIDFEGHHIHALSLGSGTLNDGILHHFRF